MLKSLKSNRQGGSHPAARRALPRQRRGDIRKEPVKHGYIKGIIGLPAEPLLRHRHPGLHRRARQGERRRPHRHLHDRRLQGLHEGRQQEPSAQPGHPQDRRRLHQADRDRRATRAWCRSSEIADPKNDYNLNIPRYIDSSEPEDIQDLDAHLHGGIPNRDLDALADYWDAFPSLRGQLFETERPGYSRPRVAQDAIQAVVERNAEYVVFKDAIQLRLSDWWAFHRDLLVGIGVGTSPKRIIEAISEDLLARFHGIPLLDPYSVYEQLMSYWGESMQDDVFLIGAEGWGQAAMPRVPLEDENRKISETPDLVIGSGRKAAKFKADLIPPALIVARFFAKQQLELDELNAKAETAAQSIRRVRGRELWGRWPISRRNGRRQD